MRSPLLTAFAIICGLIVLLGYLIPPQLTQFAYIQILRSILVGWAVILAGVASLVGILNLFIVHIKRMTAKRSPDRYSIVLVIAFLVTLGFGLYLTPADLDFQRVVLGIQVPVEASLMGVLVITLTFASLRLFQRRKGVMAVVFAASALFFLLVGSGMLAPLLGVPMLGDFIGFLQRLPIAGGRGILIGIALGSLTAGLRILLGADRPYSG
jgi:hypothetical protein